MKLFKIKFSGIQIIAILAVLTAVIIFVNTGVRYNFLVLSLFFSICLVALIGIFATVDKFAFSLNKTFYLFFFFFFGLAPAIQFKFESNFFNAPLLQTNDYIFGGALVLILLIGYMVLYALFYKYANAKIKQLNRGIFQVKSIAIYYLLSASAVVLFLILIKSNFNLMFFRPDDGELKLKTLGGLAGYSLLLVLRPVPIIVIWHYWLTSKIKTKHIFLLGVMALITAFPSSLSRGLIAAYYLPFLILATPLGKAKFGYSLSYFFGIFLIFPLLNVFRSFNNRIFLGIDAFKTGHFDAFQNFVLLLNENYISFGKQLLGSLLFFIPESVWPQKPLPTGAWLAQQLNFNYSNIAMPYFGEGFANFGFVGMLLFLILIAFANAFADVGFHKKNWSTGFKIVYLFFLGFEFFLLRGDLTSAVNKTSGFVLAVLLVYSTFILSKKGAYLNSKK